MLMGVLEHLINLLRNLCNEQGATVRTQFRESGSEEGQMGIIPISV